MKIRYIISEKWKPSEIYAAMQAIEFSLKYYKLKGGHLTIKLVNNLIEDATAERKRSNRFEIRLKQTDNILRCIFHEMTHVKQFANDGFLPAECTFKGKKYDVGSSFEAYMLSPWEMEARAMEDLLLNLFEEE